MSHRILYVQNDDRLAAAIERLLVGEGHRCERARLGREAVTLAVDDRYDFILIDADLPDIDGYEVVRRIRAARVDSPFLIHQHRSRAAGIDDRQGLDAEYHLFGPLDRKTLVDRINAACGRPATPVEPSGGAAPPHDVGNLLTSPLHGRIVFEDGRAPADCAVVAVSAGGGALRVGGTDMASAEQFVLTVPGDKGYRCEVSWRSGDMVGVRFV